MSERIRQLPDEVTDAIGVIKDLQAKVRELKEDVESYRNQRNEWSRRHELQFKRAEAAEATVATIAEIAAEAWQHGRIWIISKLEAALAVPITCSKPESICKADDNKEPEHE